MTATIWKVGDRVRRGDKVIKGMRLVNLVEAARPADLACNSMVDVLEDHAMLSDDEHMVVFVPPSKPRWTAHIVYTAEFNGQVLASPVPGAARAGSFSPAAMREQFAPAPDAPTRDQVAAALHKFAVTGREAQRTDEWAEARQAEEELYRLCCHTRPSWGVLQGLLCELEGQCRTGKPTGEVAMRIRALCCGVTP